MTAQRQHSTAAAHAPHPHTQDHTHGEHAHGDHGHGVGFVPGDLVFFEQVTQDAQTQSGGVVIALEDGLLTLALPHGVELLNMRASTFVRAWRVEHAPHEQLTEAEAYAFARERLRQLRASPFVSVDPQDEWLGGED